MSNENMAVEPTKKAFKKPVVETPPQQKIETMEERIKRFKEMNKKAKKNKFPSFSMWVKNEKGNWIYRIEETKHRICVYKDKAGAWATIYTFGTNDDTSSGPEVFTDEETAKTSALENYNKTILGKE
jgi:hypothetical protein